MVIVAAGLSPAWQQIMLFKSFAVGAVNRAETAQWCASGKVLNVGISLAHLGAQSRTIAPLGGPARAAIESEFRALGVPLQTVACSEPTRVCTTILDRRTGATTELVASTARLAPDELAAFRQAYREQAAAASVVVLAGSLAGDVSSEFYRELLERTPAAAILDARGPELVAALACRPLVVKPNREELARTVGRELQSDVDLLAAMRELNHAGAQWVVVSSGKQAVWVASAQEAWRLVPPPVAEVVNPIGCGDALAAGMAVAIERGEPLVDAVRFGMAAAADRLRQLLPGRLDPARVAAIAGQIVAQRA